MKKLRRVAGGDTYTIIYLKLLLKAILDEGVITFEGIENSVAEEIALDIDERPEDVQVTLNFLTGCGLAELGADNSCFLPEALENTGSEGASAERMRNLRARRNPELAVTSPSPCDALPSRSDFSVTERKRKEKEQIEIKNKGDKPPRAHFTPPSIEKVRAYCAERRSGIDPQYFIDFYTANGWTQGKGKPIKDWRAALRTWERRDKEKQTAAPQTSTTDAIKARRDRERAATVLADELVEFPAGSGQYRLRSEVTSWTK